MHVTTKGQVTIPLKLREKYGINADVEVEFIDENGRIYIKKIDNHRKKKNKFMRFRGIATIKMTTD